MASAYKVLGQVNPSATTNTTLYTVPAATETVVSSITVATLEPTDAVAFRIAIRPNGAAIDPKHYIAYDIDLYAGTAQTITLGLTLDATDVITVYAGTANLAFSAFGSEIT